MSAANDIVTHPNAAQDQIKARLIILDINTSVGWQLAYPQRDAFNGSVRASVINVLRQCAVSPMSKEFFRLIKCLDRRTSSTALVSAVSLAGVSAFFGIVGITAIFAAAALPIMVMVGVLEAATAAWLSRNWNVTPWLFEQNETPDLFS